MQIHKECRDRNVVPLWHGISFPGGQDGIFMDQNRDYIA